MKLRQYPIKHGLVFYLQQLFYSEYVKRSLISIKYFSPVIMYKCSLRGLFHQVLIRFPALLKFYLLLLSLGNIFYKTFYKN